ncbi:MAG TPA: hypothetical protein VMW87_01200 [Spirochaetia bacterium]|nr:hypothetical protein [Spirochaetia bacterium]
MPATAPLEELRAADNELKRLKEQNPEAYGTFCAFFKKFRSIGYKNVVKLMLEEATPEKLKGEA